ncbi:hypothetical protein, partial [Streptobacillus moniliformis]|uniref:hypothetical protein n=1 Tax=Streptobacillus moniliformis TaxID=34105 RepID=UPI0012DA53F3
MDEYSNNYSLSGFSNPSGNMRDFTGKLGSVPKSNIVNTTTDGLNQDPDMLTQLGGLGAIAKLIGSIGG